MSQTRDTMEHNSSIKPEAALLHRPRDDDQEMTERTAPEQTVSEQTVSEQAIEEQAQGESKVDGSTIWVKTLELDPAQRDAILKLYHPEEHNFASFAGSDTVMGLGGKDIPFEIKPERRGRSAVMAFRTDMDSPAVFVGPSIDPGKKLTHQDKLIVKLNLDSQTPNIEISTRKEGLNSVSTSEAKITTRFTWADIDVDQNNQPMIYCRPSSGEVEQQTFFRDSEYISNGDVEELKDLRKRDQLYEIVICLSPNMDQVRWSGITDWEYKDILERRVTTMDTDDVLGMSACTVTRDLLIQALHRETSVCVSFFMHLKPEQVDAMNTRIEYLRTLFGLASQGNFWFYRSQMPSGCKLEDLSLPDKKLVVPRWLVTMWQLYQEFDTNGTPVYSNPEPYLWVGHIVPFRWPNADEGAFLLKVGVESERVRSGRNLKELAQSGNSFFRGVFTAVDGYEGRFFCRISLSDNLAMQQQGVKTPSAGTRIRLRVCPDDPAHPSIRTAKSFDGTVTNSQPGDTCAFACLVSGDERMSTGVPFPVYIAYLIDDVPYARQMEAIKQVQGIPSEDKPTGVDLKALFFNEVRSAPDQDAFMKRIDLAKFRAKVETRPANKRPNQKQMMAIEATVTSQYGLAVIQGSPGTGKIETVKTAAMGMLDAGMKLLVTTPTNLASNYLASSFDKSAREENWLGEHEYVVFCGAYVSIRSAERLERDRAIRDSFANAAKDGALSDEDVDTIINAENILQELARSTIVDSKSPEVKLTFGYKLKMRIEEWSEAAPGSPHAMTKHASDYLRLLRELPYVPRGEKRDHLDRLGDHEYNLGLWYLENEVKTVFCTNSSSAHEILVQGFEPDVLIVDEAAQESLGGVITPAGAHMESVKQIVLVGDHEQSEPIYAAADSNVGHIMLSRSLFKEVANDKTKAYAFVILDMSYRCLREHLNITNKFYNEVELRAAGSNKKLEWELQVTLKAYMNSIVRASFVGSKFQVAVDVDGKHENPTGSTTLRNVEEAVAIADFFSALLNFVPPAGGRKVLPSDLVALTAYTGQVLAIKAEFASRSDPLLKKVAVSTVNYAQGLEWNVVAYSSVINTGKSRLTMEDRFPIHFVANSKNINVAMSRTKIGRYIFGGLRTMVQMGIDSHPLTVRKQYKVWFEHLKYLLDNDCILTAQEWAYAMEHKAPPAPNATFARPKEFKLGLIQKNHPVWSQPVRQGGVARDSK